MFAKAQPKLHQGFSNISKLRKPIVKASETIHSGQYQSSNSGTESWMLDIENAAVGNIPEQDS
jgi:hypothetical protein